MGPPLAARDLSPLLALAVSLVASAPRPAVAAPRGVAAEGPRALAERVVVRDLAVNPAARRAEDWRAAVLLFALVRAARGSPAGSTYLGYVRYFFAAREGRRVLRVTSADQAVLALPAAELALADGDLVAPRTVRLAREFFATEPENELGVRDHVGARHRLRPWLPLTRRFTRPAIWVDSLVMAVLTEARLAALQGDPAQLERACEAALVYAEYLQTSSGLFKHAYYYVSDRTAPRGDSCWLRGHAWAMVTLVELIEQVPADHPRRPALVDAFRRAARGLVAAPTAPGGLWPTLLAYDGSPNPAEVSGSLLAGYAIAKGNRLGLVDRGARAAARRAWRGMLDELETARDHSLHLGGASGPTNASLRPGSYTSPLRREARDAAYALAGLLLLASELEPPPERVNKPPDLG